MCSRGRSFDRKQKRHHRRNTRKWQIDVSSFGISNVPKTKGKNGSRPRAPTHPSAPILIFSTKMRAVSSSNAFLFEPLSVRGAGEEHKHLFAARRSLWFGAQFVFSHYLCRAADVFLFHHFHSPRRAASICLPHLLRGQMLGAQTRILLSGSRFFIRLKRPIPKPISVNEYHITA